jgi:hypothetical protein
MPLDLPEAPAKPKSKSKPKSAKLPWPSTLAEQASALRAALASLSKPASADELAKRFSRANKDRLHELLDTLVSLGQARRLPNDLYTA